MENPVGESSDGALRLDFDRRLKLEFHGSRITSCARWLAYRELDDPLSLSAMAGDVLAGARTGRNGRHALVGGGAASGCAASASQMGRFETRWLAPERNLSALSRLSGQWIDRVRARRSLGSIVLDMDSSVSPTHGEQEMSVWNGHFESTYYHPLFVFNQFSDLESCALRPGNVYSAEDWRDVLEPVVARYRDRDLRRYFRGDTAFASPDIYAFLEAERRRYKICLKANAIPQDRIESLLTRPGGRPPHHIVFTYASFSYQTGSWDRRRRVVPKVEWHSGWRALSPRRLHRHQPELAG